MRKLGISVYPNHSELSDIIAYLDLAARYGFSRVFTCLLSVAGNREQIVADFRQVIHHATQLGMEVIADVSPRVFGELGISYDDLSFFEQLGAQGIRLDIGYTGKEEAVMSFNPQGLAIELNMSSGTKYLEQILSYHPHRERLIGCHNFYPHRYTGLRVSHFLETSRQFKAAGLRTAAFVNSPSASIGPWEVDEGLCTLELHREWPITSQAKWLWATELIDDVIIANAFASEAELRALSMIDPYCLTLDAELVAGIPELERRIVTEELHNNRGDVSDYVIRSTQSRVKYKGHNFAPFNTPHMVRGDIIIETSLYEHYAGELQVALLPMENSGRSNVVGRIAPHDVPLLDMIAPWQHFRLRAIGEE